mgnify:CR=1 FL=1
MKKCAIITTYIEGNLAELLPDPEEYFVICADGGYAQAVEAGIKPDLIIGDLDSYKGDIPKDVPIEKLPVEKDDTDTVLAARVGLSKGCREFHIYGATGGKRLDHTLANLQMLLLLRRQGARAWLYDDAFVYTALENESITISRTVEWGLLSVFCLGADAHGIDLEGVQYPLHDATLTAGFPLGVSNHILEPQARISVREGSLLVGWELPEQEKTEKV